MSLITNPSHPGEVLHELYLLPLDMSAPALARHLQVPRTRIERLGDRVEVRLSAPFPPGRARINCTMPGPDDRWRWYGVQFFIPG